MYWLQDADEIYYSYYISKLLYELIHHNSLIKKLNKTVFATP